MISRSFVRVSGMITNGHSTRSSFVQDAHCSFLATARCARNIVEATLDTVAALDARDGLAVMDRSDEWSLITRGIVRGAVDFGADLGEVGEGIMLAAIRSGRSSEDTKIETIRAVAEAGVQEAIASEGDFEAMAAGLACGATEGGREQGGSDATFLSATAEGAFAGAKRGGHILQQSLEKAIKRTRTPIGQSAAPVLADMGD